MNNDKGKVIFSLIVGATAGIVAGLLLAPETGNDTRSNLRKSASRWGGDFRQRVKDALARAQDVPVGHANPEAAISEDQQAADRLLAGLSAGVPPAGYPPSQDNPDYDGFGNDARYQPKP